MNTKEGFDMLQLAADIAADWHDTIYDKRNVSGQAILMSSLLEAQKYMLRGRGLQKDPIRAIKTYAYWAAAYDEYFMRGHTFGIVPQNKVI